MSEINMESLLISILYRIDSIIDCLPGNLQDNMRDVRNSVCDIINEMVDNNINDYVRNYNGFLDMVSLYQELKCISMDLGICILMNPGNVRLEDALYNVDFVMKKMSSRDSVFACCYDRCKMRVLK